MLRIKHILFCITVIALLTPVKLFSQPLSVAVSYVRGEISKDSHSSTENYSINGTALSFSMVNKGRTGNENIDPKLCTLEEKDTVAIRNMILTSGFNVSDSLITEKNNSDSPKYYTVVSISILLDGAESKIKVNGDTKEMAENEFYQKVVKFVMYLRNVAINCKN